MKSWMTSFLLFLLTLGFSPMVDSDLFDHHEIISTALENAPTFFTQTLTDSQLKQQSKTNYIAFDFEPFVLLAETNPYLVLHSYYLPIYHLNQEKEYFLLI
jgi:hypothetical protein